MRTFHPADQRSVRRFVLFVLFVALASVSQLICCRLPQTGAGGSMAFGGSPLAAGGTVATGGTSAKPSTGGALATGGTSATVPVHTAGQSNLVIWPACDPPQGAGARAKKIARHPLGPIRPKANHSALRSFGAVSADPLLNVLHPINLAQALDQETIGACTGFATVHGWSTWPFLGQGTALLGLQIYSGATKRDPFPGAWPPNDTGSNGQAAMQEAVARGMFKGFVSVQSIAELQSLGQRGPCIVGINWTSDMFSPDRCGLVRATGPVEGGHEPLIDGWDFDRRLVWLFNSWGNDWGVKLGKRGGYFALTFSDFEALWNDSGEAECPEP